MRILLLEGDIPTAQMITTTLRNGSAVVDEAKTSEEAMELALHYDYDMVLLDLALPKLDAYDVVRGIRGNRSNTPVIILSGISHPQAKVKAFALGADDFMTKPFDRAELVARVQAVVRRSKGYSKPTLQVGPLMLNLDSREVTVDGRLVKVTSKEYAVLELLMLRKGIALTKDAFLNHLYGGTDEPEGKIIDVFICKLRKKLAEAGAVGLIGTVWGRGYMLRDVAPAAMPPFKEQALGRQLALA